MKIRTVRTEDDVDQLVGLVTQSAERALIQIAKAEAGAQGLQALWSMKFQPIGNAAGSLLRTRVKPA